VRRRDEAHHFDAYGECPSGGDARIRGPGFRPGGCEAFGDSVAEDVNEFRPAGKNFVSGAAPLNDLVHAEHEEFCG
jgi:hypothetical protein